MFLLSGIGVPCVCYPAHWSTGTHGSTSVNSPLSLYSKGKVLPQSLLRGLSLFPGLGEILALTPWAGGGDKGRKGGNSHSPSLGPLLYPSLKAVTCRKGWDGTFNHLSRDSSVSEARGWRIPTASAHKKLRCICLVPPKTLTLLGQNLTGGAPLVA